MLFTYLFNFLGGLTVKKRVLIALGGNAIKQADERGTAEEQFRNVYRTCEHIIRIIKMGYHVIITHGNGPQVGNLLIQQEWAAEMVPPQPLDVCGAMTQGQIGYMIQQALTNKLKEEGLNIPVAAVVTQVLVDKDDPDFKDPSKPVGPFLTAEEAEKYAKERGWIIKKVKPFGDKPYRRVVPSPDPITIVEKEPIKRLVDSGVIVIASGGGGIPVVLENGKYVGVEAVIDKDLAGERLAEAVGADIFLILTDVEKVMLNYGKPDQKPIDVMTVSEAKRYLAEGHFPMGSMGPKVKACIRFVEEAKGEKAIITALDKGADALLGKTGTHIVPG